MTARRRAVVVTGIGGTVLLRASLSSPPGSRRFYLLTTGLAGTWAAGSIGSGPLPVGRDLIQRHGLGHALAVPVLTGAGAFGLFYGAARIARHIRVLDRAIGSALRYAHAGQAPGLLLTASASALAEELFFRGALWALTQDSRPVLTTTLAHAITTATTRNPALVLASAATSVLFGLQRHATGGILTPALSHLTWLLLMLRYLPPLFPPPAG